MLEIGSVPPPINWGHGGMTFLCLGYEGDAMQSEKRAVLRSPAESSD